MSVNCLCKIHPGANKSWIQVTRLRLEQENSVMPRYDVVQVYLPNILGLAKVLFMHELTDIQKRNIQGNKIKNSDVKMERYVGMDSEGQYEESRGVRYGDWIIWDERTETFSQQIDVQDTSRYYFIKFPQNYWEGLH